MGRGTRKLWFVAGAATAMLAAGLPIAANAGAATTSTAAPAGKFVDGIRHGIVRPRPGAAAAAAQTDPPLPSALLAYGGDQPFGSLQGEGVTTGQPKVYLVFFGSQWGTKSKDSRGYAKFSRDSVGMAGALQGFFAGLGTNGEKWSQIATQYCDGVAYGATACLPGAPRIPYPSGSVLAGVWYDSSTKATNQTAAGAKAPQLAAEGVAAAMHFGNTTQAQNRNAQYVIVSPHNADPDGWKTNGFCAWHGYSGDSSIQPPLRGPIVAFTNLPYIPDVGSNCGAGFVNTPGLTDGVTMVEGHEYYETLTDQFPDQFFVPGWIDGFGGEIGDKCAWIGPSDPGGAYNLHLSTGSYVVQGMWSNYEDSGQGGCAQGEDPLTPPVVAGVGTATVPTAGSAQVVVSGKGFNGTAAVSVGGVAATFTETSSTSLTITVPPHAVGVVDVTVTNAAGTSPVTAADRLTYVVVSSPVVVADRPNVEDLFVRNTDGRLFWNWRNEVAQPFGTGGAWTALGTTHFAGQPSVVTRVVNGSHLVDVYARDVLGSIEVLTLNVDTGAPGPWSIVFPTLAGSDPVAVTSSTRLPVEDIYGVRSSDGVLVHGTHNVTTGANGSFTSLNIPAGGTPTAVARGQYGGANVDDVYVRSFLGGLWESSVDHANADAFAPWRYLNSGPTLTDPVVVTTTTRFPAEYVYSVRADGSLWATSLDVTSTASTATLPWGPLGIWSAGKPAVVAAPATGGDDVYVRSVFGALLTDKTGTWTIVGGPTTTDPAAVVVNGNVGVFARSIPGDLQEWTSLPVAGSVLTVAPMTFS